MKKVLIGVRVKKTCTINIRLTDYSTSFAEA